jgi:hypothetical protein
VHRDLPQARRIYLFTCRPQVPDWLDAGHPKIRLVHHDEVMPAAELPTFSSFAIVSYLHRLPGLARRFLYLEDDMMLASPRLIEALQAPDGRVQVHLGQHWILPGAKLNPARSSPWNLALGTMDARLSEAFGPGPRRQVIHGPQLFDREIFGACEAAFADLFAATRGARFRAGSGVPPENLVPHFAAATGRAALAPRALSRRVEGYASLENVLAWTWAQLSLLDLRKPLSYALNDSFGARPNGRVERLVRRWLEAKFPDPAPWERGS